MPVFIAAEAGINHLGDRAKMLALCDAAKQAGATAVKFQAYNAEELVKRRGKGDLALLKQCELSDDDLDAIAAHCKAIGIKWGASVFDPRGVYRVVDAGAAFLKVAHTEADWDELVVACVNTGLPTYVSVGPKWPPRALNWRRVWCAGKYPETEMPDPALVWSGYSSHHADWRKTADVAMHINAKFGYLEAHIRLTDADPEAAWSLSVDDFSKMVEAVRAHQ